MIKQLKTLIVFAALTMLFSCKKEECKAPAAPYGTPDNYSWYNSRNYNTVTYTYYCRNGKYLSITYTNTEGCRWDRSDFVSTGICKK